MAKVASYDHVNDETSLGFWIYLMTDCLLFASLFATYAVLRNNTAGNVSSQEIFDINYVLMQTVVLLTSSVTAGMAFLEARAGKKNLSLVWLGLTIILGLTFLVMEILEFSHLIQAGHSWQASAFLSAFFTLVGTHGIHITVGLLWAGVLVWLLIKKGIDQPLLKKLALFTLFWHFLDIIWIFIFTYVYGLGVV